MWIPTDSIGMKHIEDTWPDKFKNEVHNLQLSISMDGVNLYSLQNTNYFVWLVVVIYKNIPPMVVHEEWESYVGSYSAR